MKQILISLIMVVCCHSFVQAQSPGSASYGPVYYNFSKRVLYSSEGKRINGQDFLEFCRGIPDSAVKVQVALYDACTRNKLRLGFAAIGGGILSFGLFSFAAAQSSSQAYTGGNSNAGAISGCLGLGTVSLMAVPISLIATTIPHQRRKLILFHDLPQAYNFYVKSLTSKP
ncbi:MAG: hypothetical protein JST26_09460 [Bacteroidetes bacterium]|nr:hypothetical protein [Bacteroidota bacterium]